MLFGRSRKVEAAEQLPAPAVGGAPRQLAVVHPAPTTRQPKPTSTGAFQASALLAGAKAAQQGEHSHGQQAPSARVTETLSDLKQLNKILEVPFRGWLDGLVAPDMRSDLMVLDLRLGDCALVGTPEALASAHAGAIRNRLQGEWRFRIVKEVPATRQALEALTAKESAQANASASHMAMEERFERVYDDMVHTAIDGGASDIHIKTYKRQGLARIYLRLAGRYKPWRTMNESLALGALGAAFGKRMKSDTATRESFNPDLPQAFMTTQIVDARTWEGRANGRPHIGGFKKVIRLLESDPAASEIPDLNKLGYSPAHIEAITAAVRRNFGLIIIFGPTGSGKTTTLRTMAVVMTDTEHNAVYSVESPVEYVMPGVTQFSLPVDANMDGEALTNAYTGLLRDTMRMDPDVLIVSEIRDAETASIAAEFTTTQHRCFTTAHGGGCIDGLARLTNPKGELRLSPATVAAQRFLTASGYQRLLPVLCTHCRLPADHDEHGMPQSKLNLLRTKYGLDPDTMYVANPTGCQHCQPKVAGVQADGTVGVTVAAEVFIPSAAVREMMAEGDWVSVERAWRATRVAGFADPDTSGKTAFEHALYKASIGMVSPVDIEREFEPLETYEVFALDQEAAA